MSNFVSLDPLSLYQGDQYSHPKDGPAGEIKRLHKLAIQAIDRLQPYKAGSRPLWLIHKLNIINKHRLVITAGQANMAVSVPGGRKAVPATSEVKLLNQGDKVFTVERLDSMIR